MNFINDKIVAYFQVNAIEFSSSDYLVLSSNGNENIVRWDEAKLGSKPSEERLDEAYQTVKNQQIQKSIVNQTQQRLDEFAKTRNYDGILSLATYATSTNLKFQAEGQYGVEARDATWAKLYEIMGEVEAGTRPMPEGFADVEPELPKLEWPAA